MAGKKKMSFDPPSKKVNVSLNKQESNQNVPEISNDTSYVNVLRTSIKSITDYYSTQNKIRTSHFAGYEDGEVAEEVKDEQY